VRSEAANFGVLGSYFREDNLVRGSPQGSRYPGHTTTNHRGVSRKYFLACIDNWPWACRSRGIRPHGIAPVTRPVRSFVTNRVRPPVESHAPELHLRGAPNDRKPTSQLLEGAGQACPARPPQPSAGSIPHALKTNAFQTANSVNEMSQEVRAH
jgi:hypothetical protein